MTARVDQLLARAAERLGAAGVEGARRDARLLLEAALGVDRVALLADPGRLVAGAAAAGFEQALRRRLDREPVSRILGRREFWGLSFLVSPATLDPRPDTETLVAAVLEQIENRDAELSLVDLGTGSGCLLLALLSELPRATGIGTDISAEAVLTARANAVALGLAGRASFTVGVWAEGIAGPCDWVVSNPPYVPVAAIADLAPEVARFEPLAALDGGADGLDAYRALAPQIARLCGPAGRAAVEIGAGQAAAVARILAVAGLNRVASTADLAGIERCLILSGPGNPGKA